MDALLMVEGGDLAMGDLAASLLSRADGSVALGDGSFRKSAPSSFKAGGVYHIECLAPDGSTRWVDDLKNSVTNQCLDLILNQVLVAQTGVTNWYMGLVDNASFTAFAAADLPASHAGWIENTAYSNSTRPQWSPGVSSGQSVTNSATLNFAMTASATIRGLFIISASDKGGGASGQYLFSTAAFSGGTQAVNSGDTLKVTYTVSCAAGS